MVMGELKCSGKVTVVVSVELVVMVVGMARSDCVVSSVGGC